MVWLFNLKKTGSLGNVFKKYLDEFRSRIAKFVLDGSFNLNGAFPFVHYPFTKKTKPTKELLKISINAITASQNVNLTSFAKKVGESQYLTCWPGEHYNLLAGLMISLKPKIVIEIGSFKGLSSLVMKENLPSNSKIELVSFLSSQGFTVRRVDPLVFATRKN